MESIVIYSLSEPNGNIRYVGKTNNITIRLKNHINESKQRKIISHKTNWIISLINKNELPVIDILDIVPENEWIFWEMFWISQMKTWGYDLLNMTDGGENPPSFKNKTHSDEYKNFRKDYMQNNNPSKNMDDNWRKNISSSLKNRIFSEEHKISLGKPILQLSLSGEIIQKWDSMSIASRKLNINLNSISKCIKGERNKAGKFKWSNYEEDCI